MAQTAPAAQSGGLQSSSMSWAGFGMSMVSSAVGIASAVSSSQAAIETAKVRDAAILRSALSSLSRINVERASTYAQVTSALASASADSRQAAGAQKAQIAAYGMTGGSAKAILADTAMKASTQMSTLLQNKAYVDQQLSWKVEDTLNSAKDAFVGATFHGPTETQVGTAYLLGTATALVQNYKGDLFKDATAEFNATFNPPTPPTTTDLSGGPDITAVAGLV